MPIHYLRKLSGRERAPGADRQLALYLAFVAGAVNAGGFMAVAQYTSHMTGIVSGIADHLALGQFGLVVDGIGAVLAFVLGAACSAVLINWGRRRRLHSEYALPLMAEAALLLAFGLLGRDLQAQPLLFVSVTVMVLCFTMGLQNAMITKLSRAEIRTTHVTGMITDLGIEVGKLFYWNRHGELGGGRVRADPAKLATLGLLVGAFFGGGVIGALGFQGFGTAATIPLAGLLLALAVVPILDDVGPGGR